MTERPCIVIEMLCVRSLDLGGPFDARTPDASAAVQSEESITREKIPCREA